MIIAMAGLPGTGKSTLACALAERLSALVLNKDIVRSALFPPQEIEYSTAQDDFVFGILLKAAEYTFEKNPGRYIILDGRTFSRKTQVDALVTHTQKSRRELRIIHCGCSKVIALARLNQDEVTGQHPAADRGHNLYLKLLAQEEPLQIPHLDVDTGKSIEDCVKQCLDYLFEKYQ